jgi:putative heme d1 biosynthesis radical SAM protein NirJ1
MESDAVKYENELTTTEAKKFIDDLAEFNVPVILFSGGEPLIREDFFDLAQHAASRGIRVTISTNGTLIDKEMARNIKKIGVGYVGISLDGIGEKNDAFRKKKGAFDAALRGIRNCLEIDQRVGLRFTINRHNFMEMEDIFRLIEEEGIPRVCFYHLVYSGRASEMMKEDVTRAESRQAMDLIIAKTLDFHKRGLEKEILTVDNHADGVYAYLCMQQADPARAEKLWELLRNNGGNRTGIAIGQVDNEGNVHADQFTQNHTFGNVRERKFGEIWTDSTIPILAGLKDRKPLLKGRCSLCKWLDVCNGNFRARAEAATGDFWESDPACYLSNAEIGIA